MSSSKKLTSLAKREILKELLEREERLSAQGAAVQPSAGELEKAASLVKTTFAQQRRFFFESEHRLRVARCTRRAGKTTGAAIKCLVTLLRDPRSVSLFLGKTSTTIRDNIWPELKQLIVDHDLPFDIKETQFAVTHRRSTGRIIFRGASDTSKIEKLRGLKLKLAVLDESGTFGADFEKLVVSVIGPGLRDARGEMLLIGTPGYFPEGLFYEASEGIRPNWERHRWTLQDNPFLSAEAKDLKAICAEEGLTPDDPIFIREYRGEYCLNVQTQMFAYDPAKCGYRGQPPPGLTWYVGVDFGWTDATAIVAVGWSPHNSKVYAQKSWSAPFQVADKVAAKLKEFIAEFNPARIVGDTGGYGKGVAEQIWADYEIYIEQAEKREKLNHIEFINSAFLRGDLLVNLDTTLSSELPKVLWDEQKKDAHAKAKDNESMALLYVWRQVNYQANKIRKPAPMPELEGWPEEEIRAKFGPIDEEDPWWARSI